MLAREKSGFWARNGHPQTRYVIDFLGQIIMSSRPVENAAADIARTAGQRF